MKRYLLKPGYILFTAEPTTIMVVLGSAVAVSLYNRQHKTGGMNHFLHAQVKEEASPTALYAKPAIHQLIKMFGDLEMTSDSLEAHIFGGASPADAKGEEAEIGAENIETTIRLLEQQGVRISGRETGGHHGRKIMFDTSTGEVIIAKVDRIRQEDWFPTINKEVQR